MALRMMWPVMAHPTRLVLGQPDGEAAAHLWGLLVSAEGLLEHGPFIRNGAATWPRGFEGDLVDPVHLLVVGPMRALGGLPGAVLGWNLLPVLSLGLGAVGGAWLGARLGMGVRGRALLAGLLVCSPAFAGATVPVGRSEQLVLGWSVLHIAALHGALREGGARNLLIAGGTLGLQALGGWRPLMLLLFLEVPLMLGWARGWQGWRRAAIVMALGMGVVVPMLVAHHSVSPWWWKTGGWPSPFDHEVSPSVLGALSSLDGGMACPTPNAGRVALLLGGVGLWRRPRTVAPWLVLGVGLWLLALGLRISVGEIVFHGPSAWLSWAVSPLRAVHGWPRMAPLALIPLAVAASLGLDGVRRKTCGCVRTRWAPGGHAGVR